MKYFIAFFFLVLINQAFSQNLVLNPSFEYSNECPKYKGKFNSLVNNWSTPNYGTTDYFNSCSENVGDDNYIGYQKANSGKAYAGFYTYAPGSYREYVQGELKKTLIKDSVYSVSFYVSLSDCSSHAINKMTTLFSDKKLDSTSKKFIHFKQLTKQNIEFDYLDLINEQFYTNTQQWTKVNFEYKAKGYENYFSIGNFDVNKTLEKKEVWKTENVFSYYYIDDVHVELKKTDGLVILKVLDFETKKLYTFKTVLFEFNKVELLTSTIEELDKLYYYLIKNSHLNIEIYGHTDNIGLPKKNKELSLQRAKSVSGYLINKGIKPKRIKDFGFGDSQPLIDNSSEENRAKNRRVEFKLIEE